MAFEPYKPEVDSSRVWVNVSCDPGLKSELTVAAKKIGISVSELGRQAFRFALDHMAGPDVHSAKALHDRGKDGGG